MVSIEQMVIGTKLVRIKERTVKRNYMGREIKFLIFDICETIGNGPVMTHKVYREVWVQDEENYFDPNPEETEGEIEAKAVSQA